MRHKKMLLLMSALLLHGCASSETGSSAHPSSNSHDAALAQSLNSIGDLPPLAAPTNSAVSDPTSNARQDWKENMAAHQAFQEKQAMRNQAFHDNLAKEAQKQNAMDFAQNTATLLTLISATKMIMASADDCEPSFGKKQFDQDVGKILDRAKADSKASAP